MANGAQSRFAEWLCKRSRTVLPDQACRGSDEKLRCRRRTRMWHAEDSFGWGDGVDSVTEMRPEVAKLQRVGRKRAGCSLHG